MRCSTWTFGSRSPIGPSFVPKSRAISTTSLGSELSARMNCSTTMDGPRFAALRPPLTTCSLTHAVKTTVASISVRVRFIAPRYLRGALPESQMIPVAFNGNDTTLFEFAFQNLHGQRILHQPLDRALQRPRAE